VWNEKLCSTGDEYTEIYECRRHVVRHRLPAGAIIHD
jgi:hypothetical protein